MCIERLRMCDFVYIAQWILLSETVNWYRHLITFCKMHIIPLRYFKFSSLQDFKPVLLANYKVTYLFPEISSGLFQKGNFKPGITINSVLIHVAIVVQSYCFVYIDFVYSHGLVHFSVCVCVYICLSVTLVTTGRILAKM